MKNCDYCGRENAPEASHCRECGTPFPVARAEAPAAEADPDPISPRALAEKKMRRGILWCVGGTMFTVLTYLSAANSPFGGTYFVAWGAIIFGALEFVQARKLRDSLTGTQIANSGSTSTEIENQGYDALLVGTRLEGQGRIPEAIEAYKKIIEEFPGTGASNDAKKSLESLQARIG